MSLSKLHHQSQVVSLEALSGDSALASALGRLPGLIDNMRQMVPASLKSQLMSLFEKMDDYSRFAQIAAKFDYNAMRQDPVRVPEGLKTDFLSYTQLLIEASDLVNDFDNQMVAPFSTWLGTKLSRPQELASLAGGVKIDGFKQLDFDALQKKISAAFIVNGKREPFAPYGKVIRRNADWRVIGSNLNVINQRMSGNSHKKLVEDLSTLENRMELLIKRIKESKDQYQISGPVLNELSNATYATAQGFEFYGLLRYRLEELDEALREILKQYK